MANNTGRQSHSVGPVPFRRNVEESVRALHRVMLLLTVGQEDETDCNEGYLINEALPGLIKTGKTPTLRLLGSDGSELA